jgi:hypothetical protein
MKRVDMIDSYFKQYQHLVDKLSTTTEDIEEARRLKMNSESLMLVLRQFGCRKDDNYRDTT